MLVGDESGSGRTLKGRVEARSIDYVPHSERKGRLSDQATIWFAGSAHLLSLATGALAIGLGLNLFWSIVALLLGTVIGTVPVAAHATQGPHLGLPQMVQSRPQFGRYGALFIWAIAIAVYWGYVVLDGNLLGSTAHELGWGGAPTWAIITGAVAVLLAIFGYHYLHAAQRWITIALVLVLIVYVIGLVTQGHFPTGALSPGVGFSWEPFLMVVSAATAYQLSWAFFVSDYSRYLPSDTHKGKLMAWTWLGLLGTFTFEAVGAVGAALLPNDDIITALHETGNYVFPGMGAIMLIVGGLGLVGLTAMCIYGGSLTLLTALDSVRPIRPSVSARLVTILLVGVTGAIAGASLSTDFLNTQFYTILTVLGYMMAPWTSINLTDFFVVRKGHYSVSEMFKPDGIYGLWNARGIAAYLITFVVMLPFMYLTFYQGFVAKALNGIDIAFFVGVPVGCLTYWLLCRNLQLSSEAEVVAESDRDLEALAQPIA